MKYLQLDEQEQDILKTYEQGKFKKAPGFANAKKQYQLYAKTALDKTKNINLRVSEADLLKIKSKAVEKGIPYQTLLSSLIHQYSRGKIEHKVL